MEPYLAFFLLDEEKDRFLNEIGNIGYGIRLSERKHINIKKTLNFMKSYVKAI